jgi:hypothetical protein
MAKADEAIREKAGQRLRVRARLNDVAAVVADPDSEA